jgi:hypothetical protein
MNLLKILKEIERLRFGYDNLGWGCGEFHVTKIRDQALYIIASKQKRRIPPFLEKYPIIQMRGNLEKS